MRRKSRRPLDYVQNLLVSRLRDKVTDAVVVHVFEGQRSNTTPARMASSEDEDSSSEEVSRRHRKRDKSSSKKHSNRAKKDHRKKRRRDRSPSSDKDSYEERKRHKKDHKKDKKKAKKRSREEGRDEVDNSIFERNFALTEALCNLFDTHPALASDLPIMLIRIAGGTTFDLSQMTDVGAAHGLSKVFSCLEPFGVERDEKGAWVWKGPLGGSNELVLIKVVRTMLDQIGITIGAVDRFEERKDDEKMAAAKAKSETIKRLAAKLELSKVQSQTTDILKQFTNGQLANELADICKLIIEGESIDLDNLPDERLRDCLESLFIECGLEKSEMENDESDNEEKDDSPSMGYGLPENSADLARAKMSSVLQVCEAKPPASKIGNVAGRRPMKGPMPTPEAYANDEQEEDEESEDDEGPLPLGARAKGPALSAELIKAKADQRTRELAGVKGGMAAEDIPPEGEGREEWMLVPGKFDLLSAIKSGNPTRSRNFESKSKPGPNESEMPVDPKIRAEMDSIMQAHADARGPSLVDQHRQDKALKDQESGTDKNWKWSRDKDLDSGRRVDKNALNMVFGGASDNLKKKFQGGF